MDNNWTILKIIQWLAGYLEKKGVSEPRLNAEHLIAHILKSKRLDLYLNYDRPMTQAQLDSLKPLIKRRANREPLQYILGNQPFRNVDIKVNKDVLIPRPETEILVEKALEKIPADSEMNILELGAGSGAISASMADERKNIRITAVDVSPTALEIAKVNIEPFKDRIKLLCGNLYEPVTGNKFDLIISNPPYAKTSWWDTLEPEVREYEPKSAILAGEDGLDFYRKIINDAPGFLNIGGWLVLEMGDDQSGKICDLAEKHFAKIEIYKDFNNMDRVFAAQSSD